jgi:hypothetical protein
MIAWGIAWGIGPLDLHNVLLLCGKQTLAETPRIRQALVLFGPNDYAFA